MSKYDKFIEKGTDYPLLNGLLQVYKTNCPCKNIQFYFEQNVLTLMVSGHKTVESGDFRFEFFPGTLFIPEAKAVQTVSIPHASFDNPTECLVLTFNTTFLYNFYNEVIVAEEVGPVIPNEEKLNSFASNDKRIVASFFRVYEHALNSESKVDQLIESLLLKELLLRVFQTPGGSLLIENFKYKIKDRAIRKCISYIQKHLSEKLSVNALAKMAGMGSTSFYNKFKLETGFSPADFVLRERINLAKVLILKNQSTLKEVAYKVGFNSYEYFCTSFKKTEGCKPSEIVSVN